MKGKYKVCILADGTKSDDLYDRYSFIDTLDGGNFKRVGQNHNPDFFVIDLDIPANNLNVTVAERMNKAFVCRPIIFVTFSPNQHSCASEKVLHEVPYIGNFCKTSIPCCESTHDLKHALRWLRLTFFK